MSLTEVKLSDIVRKQFLYKVKAYLGVFSSLLVVQAISLLLSTNGSRSMGTSYNSFSININYYTGDLSIIFTLIWSFITAIIITTRAYRNDDFVFVSNRLSSHLSNVAFLFFASVIGGISAVLTGQLFKVMMHLILKDGYVMGSAVPIPDLLLSIVVSILYVFLLASLGYLVGMLVQLNRWLSVLLPTIVIGYMIIGTTTIGEPSIIVKLFNLYVQETHFPLFLLKIGVTTGLLFSISSILTNKLEVRQ
ncbi:hypothetical protein CJ195_00970 [Bacillus sp. UMB0899]|uniref:hypothetical protein n=1 Tax=Metabacillus schmidteae TaxID=2730405 RepID=UPI000C7FDF1B|nr:hypothetical protein [Metabacillus schmidteae]PMC40315.1 hypothetical protein CJ195_00970 [Bacillus sp. UMB0899]